MEQLTVIIVDGLITAGWLFIVSAGLTLIFGVMRILNLAHGSLYAVGAFVAAVLVSAYPKGLPEAGTLLALVVAAILVGLTVGPSLEVLVLRRVYDRPQVLQLLATYALLLIIEDTTKLVFGTGQRYAYEPLGLLGTVSIGGVAYTGYQLLVVGVAMAVAIGLWFFLNRTRLGRFVVAVIYDREISLAMGIPVPRIFTTTFAVGVGLAALGGAMSAPMISVVPGVGVGTVVLAFAVVVVGGLGSVEGAVVGSAVVGLVRSAAVHLVPELELFTIFILMALVLLVRPRGLFAVAEARRI